MIHKKLWMSTSVLATALIAVPTMAQTIDDEVIVTATKREQTLQEIPVAVTVTDQATIEKAHIEDISDLQSVVPSLRVTQLQNSVQTNFIIRGFGNGANNPGIEPSVGVFVDGVYRARSAGAISDLPNLERVEVLRGPQSTLFGKNASAGVISIVTAKPSYEPDASVEGTFGNYNNYLLKGHYSNGISDNAAFSLSGSFNKRDGYYKNLAGGDDQNDRSRWNVRGQFLYEPNDDLSFRFIGDYDDLSEVCCGVANLVNGPTGAAIIGIGGNLVPNDPFAYEGYYDLNPTNDVTNWGVSLQADWAAKYFDLVSISAYRDQGVEFDGDVDFTSAALVQTNNQKTDTNFFSQELRLSSSDNERFDWMLGLYYYTEKLDTETEIKYGSAFRNYADILAGAGTLSGIEAALTMEDGTFFAQGQGLDADFTQDNDTLSLFGQIDMHVTDRLTLTGGLNYTKDKKKVTSIGNSTDVFSGLNLAGADGGAILTASAIAQNFAYVALSCGLTDTTFSQAAVGQLFQVAACGGDFAGLSGQQAFTAYQSIISAQVAGLDLTSADDNPLLPLQAFQFLPPYLGFPNAVEDGKSDDNKTTFTVRASYQLYDTVNLYASYSSGYKATTWNLSRDSRPSDLTAINNADLGLNNLTQGSRYAGPEDSRVFEIGAKARFSQGSLNLAVFDQTIKGFQGNTFTGTGFVLTNAGKQSVSGIEAEFDWRPIDSLYLTAAATYLDAKYDSFVEGPPAPGSTEPQDLSGEKVSGVPPFSFYTSATYTHDFSNGMAGFIRGAYQHESEVDAIVDNVPGDIASRKVNVIDASAGLTWDNGLGVQIWGRNLFNDEYLLSAFPSVAQAGSYSGYPNQPATYGITVRKDW